MSMNQALLEENQLAAEICAEIEAATPHVHELHEAVQFLKDIDTRRLLREKAKVDAWRPDSAMCTYRRPPARFETDGQK